MHVHDWVELWKKNLKLTQTEEKNVTHNIAQFQPAITFLAEVKILSSTHH
jgi:hypothetical protein